MTTDSTYPPQVSELVKQGPRKADGIDPQLPDEEFSHASDDRLSYPWSIGTTRVARERISPRRKEECPPEVYIG